MSPSTPRLTYSKGGAGVDIIAEPGQLSSLFGSWDVILGLRTNTNESPCNKLPRGLDWLVAPIHSINALNDRDGSQSMGMVPTF